MVRAYNRESLRLPKISRYDSQSYCNIQMPDIETGDVESMVEELDGNIDDLEEALAPILKATLAAAASKLPLLDKAKLYVLATYAIESTLFSALRLNGVDAKKHPIFQELSRVKEYFAKIKAAENAGTKRSTTVDREAAARFIKHGLAGNEKYDLEREEKQAREKAGAKRKLEEIMVGTHTRFDGAAKRIRALEGQEAISQDEREKAMEAVTVKQSKKERKEAKRQRGFGLTVRDAQPSAASSDPPRSGNILEDSKEEVEVKVLNNNPRAPHDPSERSQALLQDSITKADRTMKSKKSKKRSKQHALEDESANEVE